MIHSHFQFPISIHAIFPSLFFLFAALTMHAQEGDNACLSAHPLRIVVLGSSTAAGAGPSSPDSTWVNKYRKHVQSLNPKNEVINLAQGGYTTYHLLPNSSTPPPNRPAPDTARNITKALSYQPDAIIVNMPSNDAFNYYGASEQMDNFGTIYDSAALMGVPMWICTPQPRNFDPVRIQIQLDLRDSLFAVYDSFIIEFWAGIALPNGDINPLYNSGDNVHLNDAGHAILFNRVKNKQIPHYISQPGPVPDYLSFQGLISDMSMCGDSNLLIRLPVGNIGLTDSNDVPVSFLVNTAGVQLLLNDTVWGGLESCATDTLDFYVNNYDGGLFQFHAETHGPVDADSLNNLMSWDQNFLGHPVLITDDVFVCDSGSAILSALTVSPDTLLWYESLAAMEPFHYGSQFITPFLSSTQSYYVEAVRGDLYYSERLLTTTQSNKNWNGAMFDLVGHEALSIDSMAIKVNSLGAQTVMIYQKAGSYMGAEMNPTAWTLTDSLEIMVVNSDSLIMLPISAFELEEGDSIGMYMHMLNSNSRLSYQDLTQSISRNDEKLEIITGSGITHTFGQIYFPRDMNIELFYHYGFRAEGDCHTERREITAHVYQLSVNLGTDLSIVETDSTFLSVPNEAGQSYVWSNGSTGNEILVRGADWGVGTHCFWLMVTDSNGCQGMDTLCVEVSPATSVENRVLAPAIRLYPNPAKDQLFIESGDDPGILADWQIYSIQGKRITQWTTQKENNGKWVLDISKLPSGFYVLIHPQIPDYVGKFTKK